MKLRFPMLPATALCALAALSACGVAHEAQRDFERQEFAKVMTPYLDEHGVPPADRQALCDCVYDKAEAYRAAHADAAPGAGDVEGYFVQCARDAGIPFAEEWAPAPWGEDEG